MFSPYANANAKTWRPAAPQCSTQGSPLRPSLPAPKPFSRSLAPEQPSHGGAAVESNVRQAGLELLTASGSVRVRPRYCTGAQRRNLNYVIAAALPLGWRHQKIATYLTENNSPLAYISRSAINTHISRLQNNKPGYEDRVAPPGLPEITADYFPSDYCAPGSDAPALPSIRPGATATATATATAASHSPEHAIESGTDSDSDVDILTIDESVGLAERETKQEIQVTRPERPLWRPYLSTPYISSTTHFNHGHEGLPPNAATFL
jgi:hypothetical protein